MVNKKTAHKAVERSKYLLASRYNNQNIAQAVAKYTPNMIMSVEKPSSLKKFENQEKENGGKPLCPNFSQ